MFGVAVRVHEVAGGLSILVERVGGPDFPDNVKPLGAGRNYVTKCVASVSGHVVELAVSVVFVSESGG